MSIHAVLMSFNVGTDADFHAAVNALAARIGSA